MTELKKHLPPMTRFLAGDELLQAGDMLADALWKWSNPIPADSDMVGRQVRDFADTVHFMEEGQFRRFAACRPDAGVRGPIQQEEEPNRPHASGGPWVKTRSGPNGETVWV